VTGAVIVLNSIPQQAPWNPETGVRRTIPQGQAELLSQVRQDDYGIGIPDEIKDKIFDEGFHYGETGHTGIGLYIVQTTVEEYGGMVFVEDNTPQGAVFIIRLKKAIEG
jgi:signal transduction histidine kinase